MKLPQLVAVLFVSLSLALIPASGSAHSFPQESPPSAATAMPLTGTAGGASLKFVENVGQFDTQARFLVTGGLGSSIWLTEAAVWLRIVDDGLRQPETWQGLQGAADREQPIPSKFPIGEGAQDPSERSMSS
jgi:hypothetical protein